MLKQLRLPSARTVQSSQLSQKYDAVATTWDRKLHRLGFHHVYNRLCQDLSDRGEFNNLGAEANILEIGIGTAAFTEAVLQRTNCLPHVTGIDISREMLKIASKRLSAMNVRHRLMCMDINTLSDVSNQYDLIICSYVIEHLDHPKAHINQIRQILTSGGKFLLLITRKGLWGEYIRYKWNISPASTEEVESWFDQAGFTNITELPVNGTPFSRFTSIAMLGTV